MHIHLATDHAGFELKNAVRAWLDSEGYSVTDHGAHAYDALDDFPDFIARAAAAVNESKESRGIIFGGSGQGEAMVANRYPHVRCTVLYSDDADIIRLGREHNDSNMLSIGARFVDEATAKKHIWDWLHIDAASDEKYRRRNEKLTHLP